MKKLELKQLPHRFAPCLSRQGLSHGFLPSLLMLFLMMVLLVTALATPANARRRGKVIFSMDDPMMDDYGPGYYRYPTSKLFSQNPGIYDLRKFTVIDEGSTLLFDLEFKDRIPKVGPSGSSSASGFHLLMVDIYIDKDHIFGSGITRTLAGRNIEFKPESAWDKMILISPLRDSDMENALRDKVEDLEMVNFRDRIILPHSYIINNYHIAVRVRKSEVGIPTAFWGYQVMVMGYDQNDRSPTSFYNMPIKGFEGPFHFGGGSNMGGSPSVIDALMPEGESQKQWLADFRTHTNPQLIRYAKLPMCYTERGEYLAKSRIDMKLPGIDQPVKTVLQDEEDNFLKKLKAEGFILPTEPMNTKLSDMPPVVDKKAKTATVVEEKLTNIASVTEETAVETKEEQFPINHSISKDRAVPTETSNNDSEKSTKQNLLERLWKNRPKQVENKRSISQFSKSSKKLENNNEYAGYDEDMQKYLSRNETNLAEFNKVKTVVPVVTEVAPTVKKRSKTGFFSHFFPKKKKNESKKSIVQPKTEKLDDESEEEIVEKEEIPKVSRDSNLSEEAIICHEQAKELIQKAEEYHSRYPADPRISISDLKGAGLLKGTVHCPEGGRYVILLEGETVTVDCINTGGTGHGTIRANNGGKE